MNKSKIIAPYDIYKSIHNILYSIYLYIELNCIVDSMLYNTNYYRIILTDYLIVAASRLQSTQKDRLEDCLKKIDLEI
jgi:hypothetical protein